MTSSRVIPVLVYLALATTLALAFLGSTDLIRMEPIIALGAKHMVENGSWFVPHLYGEIYAFKPGLAYWLAAMAGSALGWSEFSLRLPTAVCGLVLGLAICLATGRLISPRCGLVSGLAAATSCLFFEQARTIGFEMPMALGVGVAVLAAIRNLAKGESSLGWWMLACLGLLIGFMSKGLPAIAIYLTGLLTAAIALRQVRLLCRWQHVVPLALFLLAAGAYGLLAYREGGLLVFHQHLVELLFRGTRWKPAMLLHAMLKPAVIFVAYLPGSALLLLRFAPKTSDEPDSTITKVRIAAWSFLLTGVALFILSPVNNTRYYLPLMTPLAVLAGIYAHSHQLPVAAFLRKNRLLTAMADPAVWMVIAGCIYWMVYVGAVEPRRAYSNSLRDIAARFADHVPPSQTVYVDSQDGYSSLFWYLDRPVHGGWDIGEPLPPPPAYVVLAEEQARLAVSLQRKGLVLVVQEQDHEGVPYALCRVQDAP